MKTNESLFKNPGKEYRGAPFGSGITHGSEEFEKQVRLMHEGGQGGYFMHSRMGLVASTWEKNG